MTQTDGPLAGVRVVELASIGPGPFAAMMLADHGADVVRVDKPGGRAVGSVRSDRDPMLRGRRVVELDLKDEADVGMALDLCAHADVLLEGFRPGVTERLGLGPQTVHARNPALVYARMTGWGQDGPLAPQAGHDIDYIALTGALDATGTRDSGPVPPMNLVGDFGGGGMLMAFGICAALLQARSTGKGCVVDAAMVDGAALLMTMMYGLKAQGFWGGGRGNNILDGGAPYYGTYQARDGGWLAVGAIEEPFWRAFLRIAGLEDEPAMADRLDPRQWPQVRAAIAARLAQRDRAEWMAAFEGSDACVAPVLSMDEAAHDQHMAARGVLREVGGILQPAPAPRWDGRAPEIAPTDVRPTGCSEVLARWRRPQR